MMGFFLGMAAGSALAIFIMVFMICVKRDNRENEIYMDGFNAGYYSRWEEDIKDDGK